MGALPLSSVGSWDGQLRCSPPQWASPRGRELTTKVPEAGETDDFVMQDGELIKVPVCSEVGSDMMPRKFRQLSNNDVFALAVHGKHGAARERLVRECMRVDNCSWVKARATVREMNVENDRYGGAATLPFKAGLAIGVVGGLGSIPLIFHKESVVYFATNVVKLDPSIDIPLDEMNSWLQVGSFSWSYMEPFVGTVSFLLLAAQFIRANMVRLEYHPYSSKINNMRAERLCRLYPKYDTSIVSEFARTDEWGR